MAELSALLTNKRWIPVEFDNATIQVAYRPSSTSLKRQAELQMEMQTLQNSGDAMGLVRKTAEILCTVVCDWDLTDRGQPVPITVDTVIELSEVVVNTIMDAIGKDRQANAEEKKLSNARSGAGLPVATNPASVPNGIPSSEPRGTWA